MADFYTGNSIIKSFDTNKGIANGWLPINGNFAVDTPECESRYWKITDGKILEMTEAEKVEKDKPPEPIKDGEYYFMAIMAGLTETERNDFMDVYDEYPSFSLYMKNGMIEEAKGRIDAAEESGLFTEEQANKIKGLIDGA